MQIKSELILATDEYGGIAQFVNVRTIQDTKPKTGQMSIRENSVFSGTRCYKSGLSRNIQDGCMVTLYVTR